MIDVLLQDNRRIIPNSYDRRIIPDTYAVERLSLIRFVVIGLVIVVWVSLWLLENDSKFVMETGIM